MARWRKIDVRVWADERFRRLTKPQPNGQTLWLYLLTGPHTTSIPGLSCIGEAALAEAIGWPLKAFREAFREAFAEGLVEADWEARVVWVKNAIRYNAPESPNVVKSWRVTWDETPNCPTKDKAHQTLKAFTEALGEAFGKAFGKACPKPLAKAMANQEQEQEQEQDSPLPPKGETVAEPLTQDQAAKMLKARLGSSLNPCRGQVGALVAAGWDLARVVAAIEEHAEPGLAPWDWTKRARGVSEVRPDKRTPNPRAIMDVARKIGANGTTPLTLLGGGT